MKIQELYFAYYQVPLYKVKIGDYFLIDFPPNSKTDIIQKTTECSNEPQIYVGRDFVYYLSSKSMVTVLDYNGNYW